MKFNDGNEKIFASLGKFRMNDEGTVENLFRYYTVASIIKDYNKDSGIIYDLGCGAATFYKFMSENMNMNPIYRGYEYRQEAIDHAMSLYKHENFGMRKWNAFEDSIIGMADVVVCQQMIEHVPMATGRKILFEIQRVLQYNGLLIITSMNPDKSNGQSLIYPKDHEFEYSIFEMGKLLEETGFEIEKVVGNAGKTNRLKSSLTPAELEVYNKIKDVSKVLANQVFSIIHPSASNRYIFVCKRKFNG